MIKICDQSIFKPLSIVYEDCLNTGNIPDIWKKNQTLFLSITKVKNKLSITAGQYLFCLYREKILERLVCNSFLTCLIITAYLVQTNQVLDLLTEVKTNFCQFVIKYMPFLIIIQLSRSEVYFEIYLKHLAESDVKCWFINENHWYIWSSTEIIESFLSNRYQRVFLNDQSSTWLPITAGVPQGFILETPFFFMYVTDIAKNLSPITKHFANDTSISFVVHYVDLSGKKLNDDLKWLVNWWVK